MKRFALVGILKLDNPFTVGEFRDISDERRRWIFHAASAPKPQAAGFVQLHEPHPVFMDDSEVPLIKLAEVMATSHPQYTWIVCTVNTIVTGNYGPVKLVTKKITEKGLLP